MLSNLLGNLVTWLESQWSQILSLLMSGMSWVVQQVVALDQQFWGWIASLLPSAVTVPFQALQTSIQSGAVHYLVQVVSFVVSIAIDPTLLLVCGGVIFVTWAIAVVLHFVTWILGIAWSAPR